MHTFAIHAFSIESLDIHLPQWLIVNAAVVYSSCKVDNEREQQRGIKESKVMFYET